MNYEFKNVKLTEGHFHVSAFEGNPTLVLEFQVTDVSKENIEKFQKWMTMNQLDYIFNINQNFEENILSVDFYKIGERKK